MTHVWVLLGRFSYEGDDVLQVCESEEIARMFEQEYKSREERYDTFDVIRFPIITGANLVLGVQEMEV